MPKIIRQIAAEIKVTEQQVRAAVDLLDGGAGIDTVSYASAGAAVVVVAERAAALLGAKSGLDVRRASGESVPALSPSFA